MSIPTDVVVQDPIWFKDIKILFSSERLIEFFPNKSSTLEENLNSIVRLGMYGSILIAMYKRNPTHLAWVLLVMVVTYVVYKTYDKKQVEPTEKFTTIPQMPALKSTVSNPFMNPSFVDNGKNRKPVENYHQDTQEAEETRNLISKNFSDNLYRDIEDVFGRNNAQRQFYTVPSTTTPNDQKKYRNFLFGEMKSCKDNSDHCTPFEDLRRNPPILQSTEMVQE